MGTVWVRREQNADPADTWAERAEELADWTEQHLVNRTDRFGSHRSKEQIRAATKKNGRRLGSRWTPKDLTRAKILQHFRATATNHIIGLHAADENNLTLFGAIDIDAHGGEDAAVNEQAVLHWQRQAGEGDVYALPVDSDGKGGFHLWFFFREKVDAAHVYHYLRDLTSDWEALGLSTPPETFPKTADVRTTPERLGNWLRLPGRHHTANHRSRVYAEGRWLSGREAIAHILSLTGNPPFALPVVSAVGGRLPGGEASETTREGSVGREGREDSVYHPTDSVIIDNTAIPKELRQKVREAINKCQPKTIRVRNGLEFALARAIKGILDKWTRGQLKTIFDRWWKKARHVVQTRDEVYCWSEFLRAYDNIHHPAGRSWDDTITAAANEPVPPIATYHPEKVQLLVQVCSLLQRQNPRKPIKYLGVREAAYILGCKSPRTGGKVLQLLVKDGLLKVDSIGSLQTRKTNEYWYLPLAVVDASEVR
jgi:hypothetical protein